MSQIIKNAYLKLLIFEYEFISKLLQVDLL